MNRLILKSTLVAMTIVAGISVATLRGQNEPVKGRTQSREESKKPIATYETPEPTDPSELALRQTKNKRYDKRYPLRFDELQPDTKARLVMGDWGLDLPALPTVESDSVLSGEIVTAKGYLSNDKTGAYSEFAVLVKEIFKNDGRVSNGSIVVEREGATVRLPDGRTIEYGFAGQGMPQIGRRYVLFLRSDKQAGDYILVTGYELDRGRIFPLDEIGAFTTYKGSEEGIFLSAVRASVIHAPSAPRKGRKDQ